MESPGPQSPGRVVGWVQGKVSVGYGINLKPKTYLVKKIAWPSPGQNDWPKQTTWPPPP